MDPRRKENIPQDPSIVACIPGTIFFTMLIFGSIGIMCYDTWDMYLLAIAGAVLMWVFYR